MLIAKYGRYELFKDEKGVYFHCHCGMWYTCGYERSDEKAIAGFAKCLNVPIENLTIL